MPGFMEICEKSNVDKIPEENSGFLMEEDMEIILGSASPRRRELLGLLGYPFKVEVKEVDEIITTGSFGSIAMDIARQKAQAFIDDLKPDQLVICGDTIVVAGDEILTKPKDKKDAFRMLKNLSGRVHEVYSGVAILYRNEIFTFYEKTAVEFVKLANQEINDYIATGEPFDKAGAYGIQGFGAKFVRRIEGDYYNVVGLPLCSLNQHLKDILAPNCTYVLRCQDNTLYTGWTNNIQKRLADHNSHVASKYTRAKAPVDLVYLEPALNKSQAMKREAQIKKMTRTQKEQLIVKSQIKMLEQSGHDLQLLRHFKFAGITGAKLQDSAVFSHEEIASSLEKMIQEGIIMAKEDNYCFNFAANIMADLERTGFFQK